VDARLFSMQEATSLTKAAWVAYTTLWSIDFREN